MFLVVIVGEMEETVVSIRHVILRDIWYPPDISSVTA